MKRVIDGTGFKRCEILEKLQAEVAAYRMRFGRDICTDVVVDKDMTIARYTFQPGELAGYVTEQDLVTGKRRHCGLGHGCFWTDWE